MNSSTELSHLKYRADIDGLRAIAVLSVVLFHIFPDNVPGGFIGVDVFFVISGYLITSIIIEYLEHGCFSVAMFYARRVRRIFPALLVILIFCIVVGYYLLLPNEYMLLGKQIVGGAGFVSNLIFWQESGYFDSASEKKPLLHLWSLGVEEQFYIIWPVLLWATWRQKVNLTLLIISLLAISFLYGLWAAEHTAVAAFYSPFSRFWELGTGALVALMRKQFSISHNCSKITLIIQEALTLTALISIFMGIYLISDTDKFPGYLAAIPVIGTAFIIAYGHRTLTGRYLLSNRIATSIGLISFPLYLWHWPLISFYSITEESKPSFYHGICILILSMLLAAITYLLIEKPIRQRGFIKTRTIMAAMIATAAFGIGIYFTEGQLSANNGWNINQFKWLNKTSNEYCLKDYPEFGDADCLKSSEKSATVIIIGDSHATGIYMGLLSHLKDNQTLLQFGGSGCVPFFDTLSHQFGEDDKNNCVAYINSVLEVARTTDTIHTVILAFRGALQLSGVGYLDGNNEKQHHREIRNIKLKDTRDPAEILRYGLSDTLSRFKEAGKQVIVVLDHPELGFDPVSCLDTRPFRITGNYKARYPCGVYKTDFLVRQGAYREIMINVIKENPGVSVFDASSAICDVEYCNAFADGKSLYRDDDHLSFYGSEIIGRELIKLIRD